jgi:hypothetical protein
VKTDGSSTGRFRDFFELDLPNGVDIVESDVPSIAMNAMATCLCI